MIPLPTSALFWGPSIVALGAGDAGPPANTAPYNLGPPSIAGTVRVGNTLTGSYGSWGGYPVPVLSAQWQWSADGVSTWSDIGGADGPELALQPSHEGGYLRLAITGTNPAGTATAMSSSLGPVDAEVSPPVLSSAPAISFDGNDWTITPGAWTGADSVTRAITLDGAAVGLTGTLTAGDDGATLQVTETATNAGGSTVSTVSQVVEYIAPGAGGPVRTPTPATGRLALAGHSSLMAVRPAIDGLWPASDIGQYNGQSITDVWTGTDGAYLRADTWDFIALSVLDDEGDGTVYDPDDAEWMGRAQHAYWIALEAADRGADMWLYVHPRTQGSPIGEDENAYSSIHYLAQWLESKTSRPVYVINAARVVRHMQGAGVPDSEIFTDPNHVTSRVGTALAHLVWASITGAPGAGYDTADPAGYAAVIDARDQSYFGGFGGTEDAQIWTGADPLPNPSPRPGSTPAAPSLVSGATISGTVQVGETLTLDPPPVYNGNPTPTVEWRWQTRVPPNGAISTVQTGGDLALVEAHEGLLIRAQHRASNSEGTTAWASTAWTDPVAAEPAAGDPDQVLLWTASGYDGPSLSGNAPTVAGTVMTFDGAGQWAQDNLPLGAQKYICAAIRLPSVPADASVLFFSSTGTDLYANPQIAIETSGGQWRAMYYDDPDVSTVVATGTAATTSWTILELWTDGTTLGISIDGAADVTGTLPGPAPDTDSLRLFWTGGAVEAVQITARSATPDATQRASIRAAAQALIP